MIRTQIQLTEEQARALKMLAAEQRVSVAELIRQSVDRLVRVAGPDAATRRQRARAAAGRFHSGRPDLSTAHDEHLAEAYNP